MARTRQTGRKTVGEPAPRCALKMKTISPKVSKSNLSKKNVKPKMKANRDVSLHSAKEVDLMIFK
jgi:hypothetical protein